MCVFYYIYIFFKSTQTNANFLASTVRGYLWHTKARQRLFLCVCVCVIFATTHTGSTILMPYHHYHHHHHHITIIATTIRCTARLCRGRQSFFYARAASAQKYVLSITAAFFAPRPSSRTASSMVYFCGIYILYIRVWCALWIDKFRWI